MMRLDNDDIRAMPLCMQEQLGAALVAKMVQTAQTAVRTAERFDRAVQVAAREEKRMMKVAVRMLRFPNHGAAARYKALRDAAREGVIQNLGVVQYDGCVAAFTYKIVWNGEFWPSGVSFVDLEHWRWLGSDAAATEYIKKEGHSDADR